jgi:hypothetical protein
MWALSVACLPSLKQCEQTGVSLEHRSLRFLHDAQAGVSSLTETGPSSSPGWLPLPTEKFVQLPDITRALQIASEGLQRGCSERAAAYFRISPHDARGANPQILPTIPPLGPIPGILIPSR